MRIRFFICVLALGLATASARAQGEPCGPSTQPAYEDSEAGLQRLLEDIVAALKSKKKKDAEKLARSLLIPDPGPCFADIFGPTEGKRVAEMYRKMRGFNREVIPGILQGAAEQEAPQVRAEKVRNSLEARPGNLFAAVHQAMQVPVSLYEVFSSTSAGKGLYSLGPFLYTSGGFRSVETVALSALSTAPPMRIRVGGNVQQARLLHKPSPRYPEEAKVARIQGTVRLQVVIATDGTIKELEVKSGPAELVDSAVAAVRQWRYQPTFLNGLPVEVSTTIDVVYTLSQ